MAATKRTRGSVRLLKTEFITNTNRKRF